jgi:hypothetical protein
VNKKLGVGLLIGLGAVIVLWFGFRLASELRHMGRPPRPEPFATITDVTLIRDWMTVPYISHTYGVPPRVLFEALGVPEKENHEKSLAEINEQYFPGREGYVIELVQAAIQNFHKQAVPPPIVPTTVP